MLNDVNPILEKILEIGWVLIGGNGLKIWENDLLFHNVQVTLKNLETKEQFVISKTVVLLNIIIPPLK